MPLQVIQVDYGKQESIFETMAPFVGKLVDLYNTRKMNEWNNKWMGEAIKDLENASPKGQVELLINQADPPEDYMNMDSFKEWANSAVGMLQMEKIPIPDQPNTFETMPNKMEWNQLYKFVSELPTGDVDWSGTLTAFKQRIESGRKMGAMAENFLWNILGQGVPDQRAKFQRDVEFTNYLQQTLYPSQADISEQLFKQAQVLPPEYRVEWLRQQGVPIPEPYVKNINDIIDEAKGYGLALASMSVSGDKPTMTFKLPEEPLTIEQMSAMLDNIEGRGFKGSINSKGELKIESPAKKTEFELWQEGEPIMDFYKEKTLATTKESTTTSQPKIPTISQYKDIKSEIKERVNSLEDLSEVLEEFDYLGYDTSRYRTTKYFANLMKEKFEETMRWIKYAFDMVGEGIYIDKDGDDMMLMQQQGWENVRHYDEQYFRVTGKRLLE